MEKKKFKAMCPRGSRKQISVVLSVTKKINLALLGLSCNTRDLVP